MQTIVTDWENVKAVVNKNNELELYLPAFVKLNMKEFVEEFNKRKSDEQVDVPSN